MSSGCWRQKPEWTSPRRQSNLAVDLNWMLERIHPVRSENRGLAFEMRLKCFYG